MKGSREVATKPLSAEEQLKVFIAKYEPKHRKVFRSLRRAMRKRFPSADELAYDYNHALVIGYSWTQRGSDSIVAIAAGARGVRLYLNRGSALPDPKKLLLGSGRQTRFIWVESGRTLALPEVKALLQAASDQARTPRRPSGRGRLIIKSTSARQRPGGKGRG